MGLASAAGAAGYWVGRRAVEPRKTADRPAAPDKPVAKRLRRGMVCAATASGDRQTDQDMEALQLRARWCEGELAECRRERKAVRQPWPENDGPESPDRWADAVEAAIDACQLEDVEIELVECSEYPCAAALRPGAGVQNLGDEQQRLQEAFRGCAPLREAMGIGESAAEAAIEVYQHDARCDDGHREDILVLSVLSPDGEAFRLLDSEAASPYEQRDLMRWLYRRADDIAGLWACSPAPTP